MKNPSGKTKLINITLLALFFLISFVSSASSKIVYQGTEGSFIVRDHGTGIISTLFHKDKYMTIEYDLITLDVVDMVEPDGISKIHLPHFNDTKVKELEMVYFKKMDDVYRGYFTSIKNKMIDSNSKIDEIFKTTSRKSKAEMSPAEKEAEKNKWDKIENYIDGMTVYYHEQSEKCAEEIYKICKEVQNHDNYRKAEEESAVVKVELIKMKEVAKGVFKLSGSIIRVALGDLESILTIYDNTRKLFDTIKQINVKSIDRYYDSYMELAASVDMLQRSFDENRISINLRRVEKLHDEFIESYKKIDNYNIKGCMIDIEQNLSEANDAIAIYRENNKIEIQKMKELKRKVDRLNQVIEWNKDFFEKMQQSIDGYNQLLKSANNTILEKKDELNSLINFKRESRKLGAVASFLNSCYKALDDVYSVLKEIEDVREDSR